MVCKPCVGIRGRRPASEDYTYVRTVIQMIGSSPLGPLQMMAVYIYIYIYTNELSCLLPGGVKLLKSHSIAVGGLTLARHSPVIPCSRHSL